MQAEAAASDGRDTLSPPPPPPKTILVRWVQHENTRSGVARESAVSRVLCFDERFSTGLVEHLGPPRFMACQAGGQE